MPIGGGADSTDIASQRFASRFAFAVALAWMGLSLRWASLVAFFETTAMLTADCPTARASAACRAINWLAVRLLANDMNAVEFRRMWRKANAPHGWLMVIMCAAIARADCAPASIFSCPINANSRRSRAFGAGPARGGLFGDR
jgi:hypothetical protein